MTNTQAAIATVVLLAASGVLYLLDREAWTWGVATAVLIGVALLVGKAY